MRFLVGDCISNDQFNAALMDRGTGGVGGNNFTRPAAGKQALPKVGVMLGL